METAVDKTKRKVTMEGDEGETESKSERLKKLKRKEGVATASGSGDPVVATPTEEEVEELYAILRRVKEAVNYFHCKGTGTKAWRHALELRNYAVHRNLVEALVAEEVLWKRKEVRERLGRAGRWMGGLGDEYVIVLGSKDFANEPIWKKLFT